MKTLDEIRQMGNCQLARYLFGVEDESSLQWEIASGFGDIIEVVEINDRAADIILQLAEEIKQRNKCTTCTPEKTCDDCKYPGC